MSTLPPGKYLPRELWDEIFLWLASTSARHEGQHDSSAVRPLLQVCNLKVWKDAAEPLFFRELYSVTARHLAVAADALAASSPLREKVARWTQRLHLPMTMTGDSEADMADSVLAILMCVRRLEYLHCEDPLPPGALVVVQLGQHSPHALQVLELDLHVGCPVFLHRLGGFTGLRELRLQVGPGNFNLPDSSAGDIGVLAGWSMPALQLLSWRPDPTDNSSDFTDVAHARWFDFLARSQFPALRTLELGMFEIDDWTTAAARRFLLAHPQIETASIETGRYGVEQLLSVLSCPRVRLVNTSDVPEGYREFGDEISPRVEELVIELDSYWSNHMHLLDNIEDDPPAGLQRIVLVAAFGARRFLPSVFAWPEVDMDNNGLQSDGREKDRIAADVGEEVSDEVYKDDISTEDEDEEEDNGEDEDLEESDSDASLDAEPRFWRRVRRRAVRLGRAGIELLDEHRRTFDGRTLA